MGISGSLASRLVTEFYRRFRSYDLEAEREWWEWRLATSLPFGDAWQRKNAFPSLLLPFIEAIQQRRQQRPALLEIGPGPTSLLAWGVEEGLFEITALDPLARRYEEILARHGLQYPVKPVEGYAEWLTDSFAPESFDLVYSSNALDHVMSPKRCLENIRRVLRSEGVVCLEGFCREGSQGQWIGLHQHDLVLDKGDLVHFDRRGRRTNLTQALDFRCVFEQIVPFHERGITAFGYEPDDPGVVSEWHDREWYTMIFLAREVSR